MGGFLSHLKPENSSELLNATCGPIRGNIYRHGDKIVDGYLGIPFAKAPIDSLRYKKPVAAEKWAEPKDCYQYGPGCPQTGKFAEMVTDEQFEFEFAEDNCLTLNIWTPREKSTEFENGHPVIVYFYGGGFEVGFSSGTNDYSLSGTLPLKDVVVVTVNYRVGPLGFLTTGDDVARGNCGLWDQTLGLQWVHEHVASFGGDPNNVTIFGTSAGGASSDLLALSPHSNKLFNRFMANSGSAFCDFAIRTKELEAKIFENFARRHGYTGDDSKSLLEWYEAQSASKFKEMEGFERPASGFLSFVPNLDGDFFPKPLDQLRKEAPKMDVIVTVGEYEGLGLCYHLPGFQNAQENCDLLQTKIAETFGSDIVENAEEVQKKLYEYYTNGIDKTDNAVMTKRMVEFLGDSWFNIGAIDTAKSCAQYGNNTYLASFDYFNQLSDDPMTNSLPFKAATHGSELRYIFGDGLMMKFAPTEEEFKVMDMMSTFVTNFAKYGNPNGRDEGVEVWQKYSLSHPDRYFKIDYPKSEMREHFQNGRLQIYDEINRNGKQYQEIVYGKREI